MSIPRVKKTDEKVKLRKQIQELKQVETEMNKELNEKLFYGVKNTTYVTFALMIICLKLEGWGEKRFKRLLDAYFPLAEELGDKRLTPKDAIAYAKKITGIEVTPFIDAAYKCYEENKAKETDMNKE